MVKIYTNGNNRNGSRHVKQSNSQRHNQGHGVSKSKNQQKQRNGKERQLDDNYSKWGKEIQALVDQLDSGTEAVQALQNVAQGFSGHHPNICLPTEAVQKFRMIVQAAHHTMTQCVAQLQHLGQVEFLPVEMDWEPEPPNPILYRGPSLVTPGPSLSNLRLNLRKNPLIADAPKLFQWPGA